MLEINEKLFNNITILYLKGSLVGEELSIFENKIQLLLDEKKCNVIINLELVDIMDGFSIEIIDKAQNSGLNIKIVHYPTKMLNHFYHAKIRAGINLFSSEQAAIKSIEHDLQINLAPEQRDTPRISTSLPAAIIIKNDLNDLIYPNAFTRNLSTGGAWIEYADVSEIYDFKALFTLGLKEKFVLDLYLETNKHKQEKILGRQDIKENMQVKCDLLRVYQGPSLLGLGLKFKDDLKYTKLLSILP